MALYRLTNRLASCMTNVSQVAARELEKRGAAPTGSILSFPNGIDTQLFGSNPLTGERLRKTLQLEARHFVYLAVGRLTPQKDYGNLLVAMEQVVARQPDARLLIAGDGEQEEALHRECRSRNLQNHVYWLGERQDVPDLMNAADAFVLSSAYEGFGLVVAEAMATELPVIATASFGPEEVIADAGYVVPIHDSHALADAMLEVSRLHPAEKKRVGARARHRVLQLYSLDAAVSRWLTLYEDLLRRAYVL